jgi:hypothetical protein
VSAGPHSLIPSFPSQRHAAGGGRPRAMLLLCVAQETDGVRGGYPEYLETRGAAGESQVPLMGLGPPRRPGLQER